MTKDYDATITREHLNKIAAAMLDDFRELVNYGQCRQANQWERKALAEHYADLAQKAVKKYPELKLTHATAKTIIID